jgi:hypothetical protein
VPTERQREVFARTVRALEPYADDIVLVGGWVHALYLAEANSAARAIYTSDIDFTIPARLIGGDRPALVDLVTSAGYEIDHLDEAAGINSFWQSGEKQEVIDLDLLTEAPTPSDGIRIEGQPGLVVPGYPNQDVLLRNARWIEIGPEIHPMLEPPCRIRVPTIPAYVLVKGLSSNRRPSGSKRAKDIVYLYEITRDRILGRGARSGMPALAEAYPDEYREWREILSATIADRRILSDVAEQLLQGLRSFGSPAEVEASVSAHLRRLLGETPAV